MKAQSSRTALAIAAGLWSLGSAALQADETWTDKELKDPAALAATLADSKAAKPVILNIGPVQQIKGAVAIGPAGARENLDKLKQYVAKLPKDKEVIIYCGCCPFRRCPNVPLPLSCSRSSSSPR